MTKFVRVAVKVTVVAHLCVFKTISGISRVLLVLGPVLALLLNHTR